MPDPAPQRLTVLGATGSIGQSTLDVVARHPDRFEVFALSAQRQGDKLLDQCLRFSPRFAVLGDAAAAELLRAGLRAAGSDTEVLCGEEALERVAAAEAVDMVMAAIVGAAGLRPTLAAARAGKKVLLANKEALVLSGQLLIDAVAASGAVLLPIDSEHNAIFQALPADYGRQPARAGVRRVLLTASGGPFRSAPIEALADVTPEQACAHPNWVMGRKISVDSATMMNKGLEVIEAHWLFGVPLEKIEVTVHPQSIVHSLVEFRDLSVKAQLSLPDMRLAIAYALSYPERILTGIKPLDLTSLTGLTFFKPDREKFRCLELAYRALGDGESMPAVMNAANEIAVEAFLEGKITFLDIARVIEETMDNHRPHDLGSIAEVLQADQWGRDTARGICGRLAN